MPPWTLRAARLLYAFESWALIALGVTHVGATFRLFDTMTSPALWFAGAGFLMVLAGAVNLLNRAYGGKAPGLRRVCIGANIGIVAFSVAGGILGHAGLGQWLLVLGIVAPLTALSFSRIVHR